MTKQTRRGQSYTMSTSGFKPTPIGMATQVISDKAQRTHANYNMKEARDAAARKTAMKESPYKLISRITYWTGIFFGVFVVFLVMWLAQQMTIQTTAPFADLW